MPARPAVHMKRRSFLGAAAVSVVVGGCSGGEDGQDGESRQGSQRLDSSGPHEAPMLHERVESGDLEPMEERLPKKPYVVDPGDLVHQRSLKPTVGKYGGTFQLAQEGPNGDPIIFIGINEALLWAPAAVGYKKGIEGNVVAGYEASQDDTRFTFHLREGLRWSDGEPVTMDDVRFAFEDVLPNEEITPVFPTYLRPGGRTDAPPAKFRAEDDMTFSLSFTEPYGTFPAQLAISGWRGYGDIVKPRHYLEQFHKKYADPKELRKLLQEASIPEGEWYNLFNQKQVTGWMYDLTTEQAIGTPALTPWLLKEVNRGVYTYERNPYYFKVDTAGNQLPYMDGIRSQLVQNHETLTSKALFGQFDYLGERATFRKLPTMADKADQDTIKLLIPRQHVIPTSIFLNFTHPDPVWRKVVRDLRFRQALSLAMNRKELIKVFYLGKFGRLPTHINPNKHDPAAANRLLDEVGLDQRDSDGYRLGPDGKRFRVPFEVSDLSENHIPVTELVAEYWKKVGVYTTVRKVESSLRGERQEANKLKATVVWLSYPLWQYGAYDDYLPTTYWAPLWHTWHITQGKEGEEPPPEVQSIVEDGARLKAARLASSELTDAYESIVKNHHDNLWTFQFLEHAYWPTFFSSRVKNVPTGVKVEEFGIIITYSMEQWYIDESAAQ